MLGPGHGIGVLYQPLAGALPGRGVGGGAAVFWGAARCTFSDGQRWVACFLCR